MNKRQRFYLLILIIVVLIVGGAIWFITQQLQKTELNDSLSSLKLSQSIITDRVETAEEISTQKAECLKANGLINDANAFYGKDSEKASTIAQYAATCTSYISFVEPYFYKAKVTESQKYKNALSFDGDCAVNGCFDPAKLTQLADALQPVDDQYAKSYVALKDKSCGFSDQQYDRYCDILREQLRLYSDSSSKYLEAIRYGDTGLASSITNRMAAIDTAAAENTKALSDGQFDGYASFYKDFLTKAEAVLKN